MRAAAQRAAERQPDIREKQHMEPFTSGTVSLVFIPRKLLTWWILE